MLHIFICDTAVAQQKFTLKITAIHASQQKDIDYFLSKHAIAKVYSDTLSCKLSLRYNLSAFYEAGYLTASYDSVSVHDTSITAYLDLGNVFKLVELKFPADKEHIIREAGLNSFTKTIFTPKQFALLNEKVLRYYENNGYPFASAQLKNVTVEKSLITALMDVQTNQRILIDSITITGTAKISKAILYNYLSIKPGDLYNESLVKKIPVRIREISFVNQTKPMQIVFTPKGCYINLFLNDKKSSQIDGILGILPANDKGGKTTLTGELRLRLQNSFAHGEVIDLHWQQSKPLTQDLNVKFIYPFLFQSPFGVDAALSIHKQDTTYVDVLGNLGINYFLTGGNYLKFYVKSETSNLLSTKGLENTTTLPPYADVKKRMLGLGFRKEQLDYKYNPRKGYSVEANAGAGTRTIEKNSKVNPVVYDSVDLKSAQYDGELIYNSYQAIGKRNVINLGVQGGGILSDNIFTNELFRIGGLRSLRGFDEQSIYASQYVIGKMEYRFILDQGSYLQAFFNVAYYENHSTTQFIHDTPYGFGAGLSFETRLGFFSFNYALGKEFDNPIYIRAAKIHFGIVNYF